MSAAHRLELLDLFLIGLIRRRRRRRIFLALRVRVARAAVRVVGAAGTKTAVRSCIVIAITVVCKTARIIVRDVMALQFAPLRSERTEGGELLDRRTERLCNAGVLRRDLVHALEHLAPVVVVPVPLGGIDIALHVISEHRVHHSDGDEHAEHEHAREDDRDNGAALPAPVIAHGAWLSGGPAAREWCAHYWSRTGPSVSIVAPEKARL